MEVALAKQILILQHWAIELAVLVAVLVGGFDPVPTAVFVVLESVYVFAPSVSSIPLSVFPELFLECFAAALLG